MSGRLRLGSAGQSSHGVMVSRRRETEDWKRHMSVGRGRRTCRKSVIHLASRDTRYSDLMSKAAKGEEGPPGLLSPALRQRPGGADTAGPRAHPLIKPGQAAAGPYVVLIKLQVSPPSVSALPQRREPDIYAPSPCPVLEVSPVHSLFVATRNQGSGS